jgi:hypothetical protein
MSFSIKDVVRIFLVLLAIAVASLPARAAGNAMLNLDLTARILTQTPQQA